MKKRVSAILCGIIMAGLMLAGCGDSGAVMTASTGVETSPANLQGDTATQEAADAIGESQQQGDAVEVQAAEEAATGYGDVTIEETVILDRDGMKVTVKSLDMSNIFGPALSLLIENESGQDLTFQARNLSVNGYMVNSMLSSDVVNGKKANDSLSIMSSDLEKAGITTIADIEFSFHIFDTASWDTVLDTDPIRLATSAAEGYSYVYDDSGDVVYDGNNIRIVAKGLAENDSIFGPGVILYLENNGDKDVTVQARDVSINGFMIDPMFSCDLCAKKHAIDAITFMSTDLENNSIDQITDVELSFHVFEMEGWDTIVDTDMVTIHF